MCAPCQGCAAFPNKLDALIFVLLLETGHSERPLEDLTKYNEMVVNNCSDQGFLPLDLVLFLCSGSEQADQATGC